MEKQMKDVVSVTIYCFGIKNKCRKAERHHFSLGDIDKDYFNLSDATTNAITLMKSKMKTIHKERMPITLALMDEKVAIDDHFVTRIFGFQNMRKIDVTAMI